MNNTVRLYGVTSEKTANEMIKKLGRLYGTGGKKCFSVETCRYGGTTGNGTGRKYFNINFLPDVFLKLHGENLIPPNTHFLTGFIKGCLSAK